MCTLSCRMSFLARVTAVSGLACSSSTMNFTCAPAKLLLTSSRYIWKPSTMSLPTWAKMPVVGATKPMRNSSAPAVDTGRMASARERPSNNWPARRSHVCVIPSSFWCPSCSSGGYGCQLFCPLRLARGGPPTPYSLGNAHQAGRQKQDGEHVDRAQHVLPPRHQGAEILAQAEDDAGTDDASHQRSRAPEDSH